MAIITIMICIVNTDRIVRRKALERQVAKELFHYSLLLTTNALRKGLDKPNKLN
jgi:hypothetical protein